MTVGAGRLHPPVRDDWLVYFPEDYRWSAAMALALGCAGLGAADIGEIDQVGRELRYDLGDDEAWFRAWAHQGDRVRDRAQVAERAGRRQTACSAYLRSCIYYQLGERFRNPKDEVALGCYSTAVESFRRFAALVDWPQVEPVEVPLEDREMPAYLVHAAGATEPPPVVVYFDGLDITKEICFVLGARDLALRGISTLVVDGPGNGESIRFRGMPLRSDYEVAGAAALDYLETRADVNARRAGVLGISLGGYYAPRCASLDPRFKACVAWGAIWNYHETWKRRVESNFSSAMSVPGTHISWVLGVDSIDAALERLTAYRLDGVVQEMACAFLVLHGEHDEQVSLDAAERLYAACGAEDKRLRVFTADEGGAQHCQVDQPARAIEEFADWLNERFKEV
jgi:dienelactone hydrolase